MNTQYIEYLKTLNIREGYNYVACDSNRKIYTYYSKPTFTRWYAKDEWDSTNGLIFLSELPDNIQIDNWADTLVEVKDIKVDKISTESLLNEYNEINRVLSHLVLCDLSISTIHDCVESLKIRRTEIEDIIQRNK